MPPCLTNITHQFHEGIEGHINICGELSDQFPINNSVKQGCVLAPTLFGLFFAAVLQDATSEWKAEGLPTNVDRWQTLQDCEQKEKSGTS